MHNKIKQRRNELGLTQQELADKLGMSVSYINRIENEKKIPNVSLAIRIAHALKCKVDDIFYN